MNSIFVIIVTYEGEPWIGALLTSLRESTLAATVVVVDNASTDATCKIVAEQFPEVTLLRQAQNLGFGRGNNEGISHALAAGAEFIFLANQDGLVPTDTIEKLHDFMVHHPDYGIATPLHCSPDIAHLDRKTFVGYLREYAYEYLSDASVGTSVASHYTIRGINAAAWFVRAEVFHMVGGFDPLYFMYGEDDDLISRFHYHKVRFALVPGARFVHFRQSPGNRSTSFSAKLVRARAHARSSLLSKVKEPGISTTYALRVLIAFGLLQVLHRFLLKRDLIDLAASVLAASGILTSLRTIVKHRKLCEQSGAHFLNLDAAVGAGCRSIPAERVDDARDGLKVMKLDHIQSAE